ncbi:MAG: complex I NDUFA9 subunit family protein [Nitrospirota bacterium]|nr:complex I NDUFA9 subunit family protein [Nitrospirota bacterium]
MHILITGASGFIGRHLATALRDRGHRVTGCVRDPRHRWPGVDFIQSDLTRDQTTQAWLPRLHGVDVVINAVGVIRETGANTFDTLHHRAPLSLFQAASEAGVGRVIQISALGAHPDAASEFHRSKGRADAALAQLPVRGVVLRPSVVYGSGGQSTELFEAMAALPLVPLVGAGEQVIQPVDADDLTAAVVRLVTMDDPPALVDAVGPKPVTLREFLTAFHTGLGLSPPRFLAVPRPLVGLGAWLGDRFGTGPLTREALGMLERGNTADPAPFAALLGRAPTALSDGVAGMAPSRARLWHARLYFMAPLLRGVHCRRVADGGRGFRFRVAGGAQP